jgi:hypothetical protein
VVASLLLATGTAHAGRTFYGWLYGTEVMPERGVELETWVDERNVQFTTSLDHETTWWVAPLVGITDQLELALPIESKWYTHEIPPSMDGASIVPQRYGVELRYRFVTQDPVNAPAIAPLLRVAVKRDVTGAIRPELDVIASFERGRFHALVDVGAVMDIATRGTFTTEAGGNPHVELHPGVGISLRAVGELRFGAEFYGEASLDNYEGGHSWWIVGPNIAWTHGRFWLSGSYGFGVYGIRSAPRAVWGVAF